MIIPTRKSIKLKRGHTYEEFVIRRNAIRASYAELCPALKISYDEARKIYDRVYNLTLDDIGTIKTPPMMSAEPTKANLKTVKTGTDWRKHD